MVALYYPHTCPVSPLSFVYLIMTNYVLSVHQFNLYAVCIVPITCITYMHYIPPASISRIVFNEKFLTPLYSGLQQLMTCVYHRRRKDFLIGGGGGGHSLKLHIE